MLQPFLFRARDLLGSIVFAAKNRVPNPLFSINGHSTVRTSLIAFSVWLVLFIALPGLRAQSRWSGAFDANWSEAGNWTTAGPVSSGSATLVFDPANMSGALFTTSINDLVNVTATGITIDNTMQGTSFTLAGNDVTLGGDVVTLGISATTGHAIALGLILNGNRTFNISDLNLVSVTGVIGQTGGNRNLVKAGTGTLRLDADHTFAGQVQINGGTLVITRLADAGAASSLGTGAGTSIIRIGTGNASATFRYEGGGGSTNRQIQVGSGAVGGAGGAIVSNFGSGAITYAATTFNAAQAGVTVARTLTLGGTELTGSTIVGTIVDNSSGTGGVINLAKADVGTWKLEGTNTFSGQVQINAGTLVVTQIADAGTSSNLGTGAANPVVRIGNASGGGTLRIEGSGGTTNRQIQIGNGASVNHVGAANIDNFATGSVAFSAPTFNVAQVGAIVARNLVLGGESVSGAVITGAIVDNNTAGGGVVNLVKSDAGLWKVSGDSTFTGRVTIQAGTLEITKLSDLGVAGSLGTGATDGTIRVGTNNTDGTLLYTGDADSGTNRDFLLLRNTTLSNTGTGAISFTAANFNQQHATAAARTLTLTGNQSGNNTIAGLIQDNNTGAIGLTKSNSGTWWLAHTASTYSGATAINAGVLKVSQLADAGTASSIGTGAANPTIRIGSANATATLSYLGSGSSTNRQVQIGNTGNQTSTSVIENEGSGALIFTNPAFNSSVVTTGGRVLVLGGANPDANEIQGTIQNNDTGAVSLVKRGEGLWILSGGNTFTGATTVEGGTLRIGTGSNLANQAVTIRQGTLDFRNAAQTVTTLNFGLATATSAARLEVSAGSVLTTSGNLVHIANANSIQAIVEGAGALDLLQVVGTRTWTVADTPGLDVDLLVTANLTASAPSSGNRLFNKAGEGLLEFAGSNAFENMPVIRVSAGGLRIGTTGTLSGAVALEVRQGYFEVLNTGQAIASIILGNATAGNGTARLLLGPSVVLDLGNISYVGDDDTANTATISGGEIKLSSNRTVTVGENPAVSGPELVISSNISESGGARVLTKAGEGTVRLDGVATHTGGTTVTSGILQLGVDQAIPATGAVNLSGAAAHGTIDLNGRNLTVASLGLGGTATTVGGLEQRVVDTVGGGILTLGGNVTYNAGAVGFENGQAQISTAMDLGVAGRTFTVADSSAAPVDLLISGVVSGNQTFTKAGAGTLYLSGDNTYSGQIGVNAGVLRARTLANQGEASSLGTGATTAVIRLGNQGLTGTLEYIGTGSSTNRSIQIGAGNQATHTGGAAILNNGSGAVEFTNPSFNTAVNTGAGTPGEGRILTVGGSNTGANRIAGIIRNNAQTFNPIVSVVKQDAGLWIFEGNNTYTGSTTINGGTLRIDGNQSAATGAVFVNGGGTLTGNGRIGGATTVRSGGTLSAGTVGNTGTLDFSGSLAAESGSTWLVDLVQGISQSTDLVKVTGLLDLGGSSLLLALSGIATGSESYVIAQYGTLQGTFAGLAEGDVVQGSYIIGYGSGTNGVITLTAVPEPAVLLVLMPVAAIAVTMRRRFKQTLTSTT